MAKRLTDDLLTELTVEFEIDENGPVIYSREEERKRDSVRVRRYIEDNSPVAFGIFVALIVSAPVAFLGLIITAIVIRQWGIFFFAALVPLWFIWFAFTLAEEKVSESNVKPYTERMAAERSRLLREWLKANGRTEPLTEGQLNALQDTFGEDRIAAEQTSARTTA